MIRALLILTMALLLAHSGTAFCAEPILLGAVFAKTGLAAKANIHNYRMVRYAVNEINERGGLLGRNVVLLEYDNASSSLGSSAAAAQAVADGVCCVVGPFWSAHAQAMGKVLQRARVPMIAAASTADAVTEAGDYIFRAGYVDSFQGRVIAAFALEDLKARSVSVLTNISTTYSPGLAAAFIKRFESGGGHVVQRGEYLLDTTDFSGFLLSMRELRPDIAFLPGYSRDTALILMQAQNLGLDTVFVGGDGWSSLNDYPVFKAGFKGRGYFVSHWHRDSPVPESHAFLARYAAKSGDTEGDATPASMVSYDAVGLFADAVRRANSCEPSAIRDALAATRDYPGVTGRITFDDKGNPSKQAVIIRQNGNRPEFVRIVQPYEAGTE
ncbi:branched-chain amino acid transport system substrate-binding protein [Desulfobaculum xiamenense]|uniref:Branched-chain amino acid transport system substrate-binding protein n=1 Tax=Desulfobaculum xiamenense TaxID=995050 RepID=A0A846QN46_9BACT|nr:ABC transporter substrate-binding protein [Desulfobaculum xiamenense]NJB68440.1 branched-chain amino acid transport system substrate-binding protein [Desulfobaculum xiamenense]